MVTNICCSFTAGGGRSGGIQAPCRALEGQPTSTSIPAKSGARKTPPLNQSRNVLSPNLRAAREKVVGWYHTGPRLREADLDISDLMGQFCDVPILVICDIQVRCGEARYSLCGD